VFAVWEDLPSNVSSDDHHSAYLARAIAALTPAGRARIDELLAQLASAVGGREPVTRFAAALKTDVDLGRATAGSGPEGGLSRQDVNDLLAGFMQIRDQEPLEDVADWANAVVVLLEDLAAA
jgi:hypothetical protein